MKAKGNTRSRRYLQILNKIDVNKIYPLEETVKLLKGLNLAKFDASVDVHVTLSFDQKKVEQPLRFTVKLPYGIGREKRILLFSENPTEGVRVLGNEETIKAIESGEIKPKKDFDVVIATPSWMPKLTKIAKILGPQGLMPSPKTNTVTPDPEKTIQELKKGAMTVKAEPNASLIHATIGKISFPQDQLLENLKAFLKAVQVNKPAKIKGTYLKKVVVSTTMSPGIKVAIDNK